MVSLRGTLGSILIMLRVSIKDNKYRKMRAINILRYGRFPEVAHVPLPEIQGEQVLLRMKYAPVNPSDINFFQGRYGLRKENFPIVGFQGSAIIEAASRTDLIGKKVSVLSNMNNGTHATHLKCSMTELVVWPDEADLKDISMCWINPFSCLGMVQLIKKQSPENVLLSASASQLSISILKTLKKLTPSIKVFGMARSNSKNQMLMELGLTENFPIVEETCEEARKIKGKTVFLDCIGGDFAGKVFSSLPPDSLMINYGRLSGKPLGSVDLSQLYFKNKFIRGFWLNTWLNETTQQQLEEHKTFLLGNFKEIFKQNVRKVVPLDQFMDGYRLAIKDQSQGKILLDLE